MRYFPIFVDLDDRSRWCTRGELDRDAPTLMAIAGDPRFVPLLHRVADDGAATVAATVPTLATWARRGRGPVSTDEAAAVLEAVDELARHGIEVRRVVLPADYKDPNDFLKGGEWTRAGLDQSCHQVQKGGLPRSIWPQNKDDRSWVDRAIRITQYAPAPRDAQILKRY